MLILLFLFRVFGLLSEFTHWTKTSHEIRIIQPQVAITIVPSDPILNVFFSQIAAKFEISEENSEIIWVDMTVSIQINMPENLKHTEVFFAHQLLLVNFHRFDSLDLLLKNFDDCVLDVVAEFGQTIVLGINIILFGSSRMLLKRISGGTNHLLEVDQGQPAVHVGVECID